MKPSLERKLRPFFEGRSYGAGWAPFVPTTERYIPRGFHGGNGGWGVFDRLEKRFLSDKETERISAEDLMGAQIVQ